MQKDVCIYLLPLFLYLTLHKHFTQTKSPIPGMSVLSWCGILTVRFYFLDGIDSLLAWCPFIYMVAFPCPPNQKNKKKKNQNPTPQLWLGRKIPFDPETALGLLPCMEEPANSSEKKVLTQTRCNLLSACQHLECWQGLCTWACMERPSLSISEVALMC